VKRIFRIFPPYFFVLLIYIFIPAFHERETLPPLWKFFTFTQNYGQDITRFGTFSHAWSLCVEEQFYLLLPLLLILIFSGQFAKKAGWLIPGIFMLTLALRWITWIINGDANWYKWIYYPTYTRLDGLIVGVSVAAVYRFRPNWLTPLKKYAGLILLAGLILFAASNYICRDQQSDMATLFGFSLIAIAFGFFVLSSILPGSILFRFNSAVTTNLAILSYSLYLSHKGIIHLTQKWLVAAGVQGDSNWMLVICIFTCLLGAALMRLLIEKPFLHLRNQYLANNRKKSIVPDAGVTLSGDS
jgi:peptidoglycan/LPS O-acetylase OafA/YrhL